jgi:hypothetical protein
MLRRSLNQEVSRRIVRSPELGANSGVSRIQRGLFEARPVAPDGAGEGAPASFIERIVHLVDPGDIRAEAHAAGEIERGMNA